MVIWVKKNTTYSKNQYKYFKQIINIFDKNGLHNKNSIFYIDWARKKNTEQYSYLIGKVHVHYELELFHGGVLEMLQVVLELIRALDGPFS
jgi:hypothetical protein